MNLKPRHIKILVLIMIGLGVIRLNPNPDALDLLKDNEGWAILLLLIASAPIFYQKYHTNKNLGYFALILFDDGLGTRNSLDDKRDRDDDLILYRDIKSYKFDNDSANNWHDTKTLILQTNIGEVKVPFLSYETVMDLDGKLSQLLQGKNIVNEPITYHYNKTAYDAFYGIPGGDKTEPIWQKKLKWGIAIIFFALIVTFVVAVANSL